MSNKKARHTGVELSDVGTSNPVRSQVFSFAYKIAKIAPGY